MPVESQLNFTFYQFENLSLQLLYAILSLRQCVFVVEQRSIYTDLDDLDQHALHLCVQQSESNELTGYARLRFDQMAGVAIIERVVIAKHFRRKGLANRLMQACIEKVQAEQVSTIKLSAQIEVIAFYQKWGFVASGDVYDDGGIEHQDMFRKLNCKQ